jgi:pyruvate-formate lyase-activating enzyme
MNAEPLAPRSPVPDLIFEATQLDRLAELGGLLQAPRSIGAATPLHRLTVFLTDRCNLACAYCKAARPPPAAGPSRGGDPGHLHDLASFTRLLEAHAGTPLRHVHFTGGEPTLVPGLPGLLRLARRHGVERLSLTSNGAGPPGRFLALVDAGLDELRLSLDAADPVQGEALTGRRGAWAASVATLAALARARRAGARFHLVVNTVVGAANRADLPRLVRFLLGFGPDDVKLITDVDGRDSLADFPGLGRVRGALAALLEEHPPWALPLLRLKLATVFAPDAIGLGDQRPPPGRRWRCLIPLTERTVDGRAYYPCSVYRREGGRPLGPLADAPELQRERSARFVEEADCLADPICRRYCLHCTRTFNARANEAGR